MKQNKEKCAICGYSKYKGALHVHHIDGHHDNNTPSNIQILCGNCHVETHHNNNKTNSNIKHPLIKIDNHAHAILIKVRDEMKKSGTENATISEAILELGRRTNRYIK